MSGNETVAGNKTFSGTTTAYNIKAGQHVQSDTTVRDEGIAVLDSRNAALNVNSLSNKANFFFTQNDVPVSNKWWAILYVKGWGAGYSAWELAGPAHNGNEKATPLYVRTGHSNNTWGPWREILDTNTGVKKSAELQTTNPFAPSSLKGPYISKIDNAFYAANKRWTVTKTGTTSGYGVEGLFDGSYETVMRVPKSGSVTINMDFSSTTYFPGYPYGYILVSFYYSEVPASVTGRVYCNYEQHGVGWHDIAFSPMADNGTYACVYRSAHQGLYNISQIEITVTAGSSTTAGITQIEMHLDRPYSDRNPFLSKYSAEELYYPLTLKGGLKFPDTTALPGVTTTGHFLTLGTNGFTDGRVCYETATNAANTLMNALSTGGNDPVDTDYYISQYANGGTTNTTYHRRPMSALWNYIKGKISSVLGLSDSGYTGNAATATTAGNVTGTVAIANGGTGKTTAAEAWTALGGGAIGKKASLAASDIPNHASSATTYGTGTDANYGHLKLSASTSSTSGTSGGIAATPSAVKAAYDLATTANGTANSALSAATGALQFDTTYTIANGTATFSAHVYQGGEEITSTLQDSQFTWFYRLGTNDSTVSLGTGKTKAVTITVLGYGGSVGCAFDDGN